MPNMLDVIRELKGLQAKERAGQATPLDVAKIAELQEYMTGKKKPDAAPAAPVRPPAGGAKPAAPPPTPPVAAGRPAAAPTAAPAAKPVTAPVKPAAPAAAAKPQPRPGDPDSSAFALSLDSDLMDELGGVDEGEDRTRAAATTFEVAEPSGEFALDMAAGGIDPEDFDDGTNDETDAARTTFEVAEESGKASGANPFALEIPEGLDDLDLAEDNQGGVTHELADGELDDAAVEDDPFKVKLKDDFAKSLEKADGKSAGAGAPTAQMKGTPMVPDAHYEKLPAAETSVVVQLRDGRIGKGVAGAFSPMTPQFTLNTLVPGKTPVSIKLEECLTIRFVKAYNGGGAAATPFPAKPAPGAVTPGEKMQVQLLDGEKIVGTALAHKEGDSFMLIPVPGGNVKRMWISAKAVRAKTKL